MAMRVESFFDRDTFTVTYVVTDPETRACAIIDPVLDFDAAAGRTSKASADSVIAYIRDQGLRLEWILETHAHADHLSAGAYIKSVLGGKLAIGAHIVDVQKIFAKVFNLKDGFVPDGTQFDVLFKDGDTLFMPDYGSARADFPGGDPRTLYRSMRRILALPERTRIFTCHDYKAEGRVEFAWESTVVEQRKSNIHVRDGIGEDEFVAMRTARDKTLGMPRLILPSIQVNIRAGALPPAEDNGVSYLKLPLNAL